MNATDSARTRYPIIIPCAVVSLGFVLKLQEW
jgi:hypothetical protein